MRPHSVRVTCSALVILASASMVIAQPRAEDAAADLIGRAGNADDDAERLALLKELRALPHLDADLAAGADKLIAVIEQWVDGTNLHFYSGEVSRNKDFDFGMAEGSPLYPLTYLYRGRMVLTIVMQNGNIWSYPDRRAEWFGIARRFFEKAHEAFPENRIARMHLGESIPWECGWAPIPPTVPEWAIQQRHSLEGLSKIIEWWIDNRQQENGAFGGGWGDDCEMWRWWVPVLVGFSDPKINEAQASFSEALMSQEHMRGGYMSRMTDVEHSAEDSTDAIQPMMHLEPESYVWRSRALRLAELMRDLWTARNERGMLQFRSTYFTVHTVLAADGRRGAREAVRRLDGHLGRRDEAGGERQAGRDYPRGSALARGHQRRAFARLVGPAQPWRADALPMAQRHERPDRHPPPDLSHDR